MSCKDCAKYKSCVDRKQVKDCLSRLKVLGFMARKMLAKADREINRFLGRICKNYTEVV